MIDWNKVNNDELKIIEKIADRFLNIYSLRCDAVKIPNKLSLEMDITATHIINPLRLNDLLYSNDFDLIHDISGIMCYINRQSGELNNFFLPRFSLKQ